MGKLVKLNSTSDLHKALDNKNRDGEVPRMCNLKHLAVRVISIGSRFLYRHIPWMPLIKASPKLHKFEFMMYKLDLDIGRFVGDEECARELTLNTWKKFKCCHKCLEVVEFSGYIGDGIDKLVVQYLLEIGVSLRKITVFPCTRKMMKYQEFRQSAMQLRSEVPSSIEVLVPDKEDDYVWFDQKYNFL